MYDMPSVPIATMRAVTHRQYPCCLMASVFLVWRAIVIRFISTPAVGVVAASGSFLHWSRGVAPVDLG